MLQGRLRHFPSRGQRVPASGLEAGYWAKWILSLMGITFLVFLRKFLSAVPKLQLVNRAHSVVLENVNKETVDLQFVPDEISAEKQHYSFKKPKQTHKSSLYKKIANAYHWVFLLKRTT